uniref:Nuclear pore complex protein Nup160 n=3 Tax=Anthurium amnicola TaxID=1678845 RepID=A0A1D1Y398_9ARAE
MASPAQTPPPNRPMDGMEVPIVGSDKVRWIELTVPSSPRHSSPPTRPAAGPESPSAPPSRNAAACHVIPGDPPAYLIWRIHKNLPHALEVIELFPHKEFPESGLRLLFPEALFPFSFICKDENVGGTKYLLYALTVLGTAYLFKLGDLSSYISGSVFRQSEVVEFDVQMDSKVTAMTATFGRLLLGRQDGLVTCYQLGILEQSAPGFMMELRDDVGIGRLWSLVSRGKTVGMVKDLVISQVCERKLIFVLHLDGTLRVWDLITHTKLLSHNIVMQELTGSTPSKICVGDPNNASTIPMAVLYGSATDIDSNVIAVHHIHFYAGDKISLSLDSSVRTFPLDQGRLIDLKLTSCKLWVLKEDGSMLYDLFHSDIRMEHTRSYGLQEDFISDQLFQGPDHPSEDLMWNESPTFSSLKEQVPYIISSIFLRRLLQPGVHQSAALHATIMDHRKYLTDHEFQSLNVAGLKKAIFSIIEVEGIASNPISMFYYWKKFCAQFVHHWSKTNTPYSLFVDSSTGSIGLIRESSISVFRNLEHFELLIYGSFDEVGHCSGANCILPSDDLERDIIFEVLRCMSNINHQLGRAAPAAMFLSLVNPEIFSFEDITSHLLKILETGYCSPITASLISQVGVDTTWEKRQADHRSHRKFSVDMMLSLHELYAKATAWGRVLDIVEKYLNNLIPKCLHNMDTKACFNIKSCLLIQATSQMAKLMLESSFDILLLLRYLVNANIQVNMEQSDIFRITHRLVPMIQDIIMHWFAIYFLATTSTESPTSEDFSSRLSSLHIDNKPNRRSWDGKLGTSDFTLACLLDFPSSLEDQGFLFSTSLPQPGEFVGSMMIFCSWIIWGKTAGASSFSPATELASVLLGHSQYEAAENLLIVAHAQSSKKKESQSSQCSNGEWCACLHLLGFCFLVRAHTMSHGVMKEEKIREAARCFFRAASGEGASFALGQLSFQTGLPQPGNDESMIVWKFDYYQWAMQTFEQYNMSEGACQFALAALEQVDEVVSLTDGNHGGNFLPEHATTVRGRLWANVFKFMLDLNYYRDAYCAIISNPDDDSKYICLRRFIIVLCERGATKVLCDGDLPFVGLLEKVERELFWKAERSDITAKPNLYKLLYSFESYRSNWRRAASYMYRYTVRLRREANFKEHHQLSLAFQERIWGLSAAISALQLVNPAHAWLDCQHGNDYCTDQYAPNKRARKILMNNISIAAEHQPWNTDSYVDVETLEKEYLLTSAYYLLVLVKDPSILAGSQPHLENLVDALVLANFYDMAFTVLFKFWKGSALKKQMERVFIAVSEKCCESRAGSSFMGSDMMHGLLLTSSKDGSYINGKVDLSPVIHQPKANAQWETLEHYLEKYKKLHPRLPVIVADTLLHNDPQIDLPLWLVHMFKVWRRTAWGMAGQEADPASLFRLYIDYGRYPEATTLLLEYLESFVSMGPAEIVNRKRMCAVWFPCVSIERLWCQLEETQNSGCMVDQCDKLKGLLKGALIDHLKQVKLDSDDALASARV